MITEYESVVRRQIADNINDNILAHRWKAQGNEMYTGWIE